MSTSRSLDYDELYQLFDPVNPRALRLKTSGALTLPEAAALFRGELQLAEPLRLQGYMGGQLADVLWTGFYLVVVSDRVVSLLSEAGITGWSTYPVEVFRRKGEFVNGYHGWSITGKAGRIDRTRGEIVIKPPIVPGGKPPVVRRGLYFDETKWDGTDIYILEHTSIIVAGKRVKQALEKVTIRNIGFTPLPEFETDLTAEQILDRSRNAGSD